MNKTRKYALFCRLARSTRFLRACRSAAGQSARDAVSQSERRWERRGRWRTCKPRRWLSLNVNQSTELAGPVLPVRGLCVKLTFYSQVYATYFIQFIVCQMYENYLCRYAIFMIQRILCNIRIPEHKGVPLIFAFNRVKIIYSLERLCRWILRMNKLLRNTGNTWIIFRFQ